jgi:hypothetical protein
MVSIRRKLGAFVAAVAIAAAMVMMPTPIHAKQKTGTLGGFCAQLLSTIEYLESLPSNLAVDLTLASLRATYGTYCGQ